MLNFPDVNFTVLTFDFMTVATVRNRKREKKNKQNLKRNRKCTQHVSFVIIKKLNNNKKDGKLSKGNENYLIVDAFDKENGYLEMVALKVQLT